MLSIESKGNQSLSSLKKGMQDEANCLLLWRGCPGLP